MTEDLLREVQDAKKRMTDEDKDEITLGSLDAKSLYPSLDIVECSDISYHMVKNSKINIEGMDWKEAEQYLAIT